MPTITRTLEIDLDFEGQRASREDAWDYNISAARILVWDRTISKHRGVALALTDDQVTQLCEMFQAELDEEMEDDTED